MSWLSEYPYFVGTLVLLLLAAVTLLILPRQRYLLLVCGLLSAPSSIASFLCIPGYWNPRVLVHFITSLEDIIFSIAMGTTAWFFSIAPFANRIRYTRRWSLVISRYLAVLAIGLLVFVVSGLFSSLDTHVMHRLLTAMVVVGMLLSARRLDMLPLAIAGSITYMVFYGVIVFAFLRSYPETIEYWNPLGQLPFDVLGIPGFELAWAAAFGFTWPFIIVHCFDVQWLSEDRRPRSWLK